MMATAHTKQFDLIIAGGGMVGASLACLLEKAPLKIALVDRVLFNSAEIPYRQHRSPDQPVFDPRVSAISKASKDQFSDLGLWQDISSKRCCGYRNMEVWDADGTGSIEFSAAAIKQSELGTIIENSIISTALHDRLSTIGNLQVIAPFAIDSLHHITVEGESGVELRSENGDVISAKLLVAADGANSRIRQLANFATREWDYHHQALVTTVRTEKAHNESALQRFMDTGPLAFLPLYPDLDSGDQHYCSIVWSMLPEKAEQVLSLSDDQFALQLAAAIEHKLGAVEWAGQRLAFPLRQRHAVNYVQDNIALVGDAAHTIHPLAGQGVNLGLLDVKVLAEELLRGIDAGRQLADATVLRRYQRKRIGHNLSMMWLMEGFKLLFAEQPLPIRWLRNIGMSGADNLALVKNQLARRAMGLDR
jgi:2-octaprenylphenol hydroxylase